MKKILFGINILALVASSLWLITDKSWEPLITTLGLLGTLLTLIFTNKDRNSNMRQRSGKNSTNIQIGGNYTNNR